MRARLLGLRLRFRQPPPRGAALLVAMVLVTVVTTLASGMVWQQWRAAEVETAERARVQAAWVLLGAQDWARLILREDARSNKPTALTEPWATPLAEARLSTFLAADREHTDETAQEAFVSGQISEAQARYNLRNLLVEGKVAPEQLAILQRLCLQVGLAADTASLIANQWLLAQSPAPDGQRDAPLPPQQLDDLAWFGLPPSAIARLRAVLVILPNPTPVNINTAPREVLAGVIAGIDGGGADRLLQLRQSAPFRELEQARTALGLSKPLPATDLGVQSSYFVVRGRMRLDQRVLDAVSLIERRAGLEVVAISRLNLPAPVGQ